MKQKGEEFGARQYRADHTKEGRQEGVSGWPRTENSECPHIDVSVSIYLV